MTATPAARRLIAMLKDAGASPYDSPRSSSATKKMVRLRLSGLQPLAIEQDRLTPNVWLDARYRGQLVSAGLECEKYEASRGRHSGLRQVSEFNGADLVKVRVTDPLNLLSVLSRMSIASSKNGTYA